MRIFLETERLILRRFTEDDVENLVELDSDPEVMRYLNGGIATPREVVEQQILQRFLSYYERYDGFGVWAAIERSSGAFIGWFSFRPHDESRPDEAEVGYRLRRSAWGRGYATEGAQALIRKGFTELGVQRVTANTYEHNSASRRVMEKVGMTLVRRYRPTLDELTTETSNHLSADSVWDGDEVEYALTKAEWERGTRVGIGSYAATVFCYSAPYGEGADGERGPAGDGGWDSEEAKATRGQAIQRGQVLDDGNTSSQQCRVGRALWILCVVDIGAVDTHQRDALLDEMSACFAGQKWTGAEVIVVAPAR